MLNSKKSNDETSFASNALIACVRFWEDQQRHRIRVNNLISAIMRTGVTIPNQLKDSLDRLKESEDAVQKLVVKEFRKHPLASYCKNVRGLGEHNAAVLLAMLDGDPYVAYPKYWVKTDTKNNETSNSSIADLHEFEEGHSGVDNHASDALLIGDDREHVTPPKRVLQAGEPFVRTPIQLWAYCGIGKPGRRTANITQEEALSFGKPLLKCRMRLIAECLIKANNPTYRAIYDSEKVKVSTRNHADKCPQCKAKAGDPWRKGHQHAHALRVVAKRFLLDLWLQAKAIHMAEAA